MFDTIAVCIGDSYYEMGEYIVADRFYSMSLTRGSGIENPYVWYVKGRNLIKLGNKEEAIDALMRAYMLDGNKFSIPTKANFYRTLSHISEQKTNVKPINNILLVDVIWTFKYYLSKTDIHSIEQELSVSIPADYKAFLIEHNGICTENTIVRIEAIEEETLLNVLFGSDPLLN